MTKCYKCRGTCNSVGSIDNQFKCGTCKDYANGYSDANDTNPFLSTYCNCRITCSECEQKKCYKCGSIKRDKAINHCKNCKKEISLRVDGSDIDRQGNWVDTHGRIIGSGEECVNCGIKTVCQDCAIAKVAEKNNQQTIIKNQAQRIKELENDVERLKTKN